MQPLTIPAGALRDGLLGHLPSRGSLYHKGPALQKVNPFFGGPPSKVFITFVFKIIYLIVNLNNLICNNDRV